MTEIFSEYKIEKNKNYEIKYRKPEEMKDSGIEWLGEIPKDWEVIKLKYLSKINPPKSEIQNKNIDCTFAPMDKIHNGVLEVDTIKKVKVVYDGYTYFKENDIIMAKVTPCYENGDIAIAKNLVNKLGFGTTEINVFRAKESFRSFIYYFLQERRNMKYGETHMVGAAGLKRVPTNYYTNLKIPLSQNVPKIANFLDVKTAEFDNIIQKKEELIKKLEEAKKNLISEVVTGKVKIVDGEPLPRKPEEMKDSGVEWLGEIPKDWDMKKLKYLVKINPSKSEIKNKKINCTFAPMERIHNGFVDTEEIKQIKAVYGGYTYFRENDIVIAKVTPCYENGDIAIAKKLVNGIGFGTTEINVFRVRKYSTDFIYYSLQENHIMKYGESHMVGAAGLKRVPTDYYYSLKIPVPNIKKQILLSSFLNKKLNNLNIIIQKNKTYIEKLKEAKQSLISEAVTGKIDLRDWDIIETGEQI